MIEINLNKIKIVYNNDGILEHVINTETNNIMLLDYFQVGKGYEMIKSEVLQLKTYNAVYVKIVDLDILIPKFLFIPINKF